MAEPQPAQSATREEFRQRVRDLPIHTVVEQHRPRSVAERNTKPIPRTFDAVALDGVWDIYDGMPWPASVEELTAEQCMFRAYDALVGAAERFETEGKTVLGEKARWLAREVALCEPKERAT